MSQPAVAGAAAGTSRWGRRPVVAALVRVGAAAVPALLGLGVALLSGPAVRGVAGPGRIVAVLTVAVAAAAVVWLTTRLAARALPLAWLLGVDAAFPGVAPSRFAIALRTNRTAALHELAEDPDSPSEARVAAERILVLAGAITAHDRRTRGHSERVRAYTRVVGEAMGLRGEELDRLAWAGLLHDVGKLVVEPEVLVKPSRLDVHERRQIHQHPVAGHRIAEPLRPWLGRWGEAILHHHERWDGTGYPFGLAGEAISLGGRIVAVADAFEAMTATRTYNTPRTLDQARQELAASAGTHFDPAVVRAFLGVPLRRLSLIALPTAGVGVGAALPEVLRGLAPVRVLGEAAARAATAVGVAAAGVAVAVGGGVLDGPGAHVPAVATVSDRGSTSGFLGIAGAAVEEVAVGGSTAGPVPSTSATPEPTPSGLATPADPATPTSAPSTPTPTPLPAATPSPQPSGVPPAPPAPPAEPAPPPPGPAALPLPAPVATVVEDLVEVVDEVVDEVTEGAGVAVPPVVEAVAGPVAEVVEGAAGAATAPVASVAPPAADVVGGVTDTVVDAVEAAPDLVTDVLDGVGGLLGD